MEELDGISATVEHAKKILDLFKDSSVQFRLYNIMNIPTSRIGAVHATPQTIVGTDHWNADVRNYINILMSYHQMSLDKVRAFSGWFMGNKTSTLTKSSNTHRDRNVRIMSPGQATNPFRQRIESSSTQMTTLVGI